MDDTTKQIVITRLQELNRKWFVLSMRFYLMENIYFTELQYNLITKIQRMLSVKAQNCIKSIKIL